MYIGRRDLVFPISDRAEDAAQLMQVGLLPDEERVFRDWLNRIEAVAAKPEVLGEEDGIRLLLARFLRGRIDGTTLRESVEQLVETDSPLRPEGLKVLYAFLHKEERRSRPSYDWSEVARLLDRSQAARDPLLAHLRNEHESSLQESRVPEFRQQAPFGQD